MYVNQELTQDLGSTYRGDTSVLATQYIIMVETRAAHQRMIT